MTQASQQDAPIVAEDDPGAEFRKLLDGTAKFRQGPLVTEDKLLEFMEIPAVRSIIEHAFTDDSLTDQQRTAKATAIIEQARVALANSDDKEKLLRCTTESFIQTIAGCASLDLSFTKVLGQAHIVRFGQAATLMVGYQGFITLIIRTGAVSSIQVEAIYKGETYSLPTGKPVVHERRLDVDRIDANIIGVYAEARNITGPPTSVILNRQEMEKIKRTSKAKDGPWRYWEGEQWKKSAVRRLQKQLPKGADERANQMLARALEMDNRDFGLAAAEAEKGMREHGRQLYEDAKKSRVVDVPKPEDKAAKLVFGPQDLANLRRRVAAKRRGEHDLSNAEFLAKVCQTEVGVEKLERLNVEQFRQVVKALGEGLYDWITGDRFPDDPNAALEEAAQEQSDG